jgi:predicted TIM-barrel fold metal-dependent hydrolase
MKSFTNIHSHIFTAKHSPDYFLKTALPTKWPAWLSNIIAKRLNDLLQRKNTRWVLKKIIWLLQNLAKGFYVSIERLLEFIEIGTSSTQQEIFNDIADTYRHLGDFRIVALTQVLDYLDLEQPSYHTRIQTQVHQVAEIKRNALYQNNICPFLGIDPRMINVNLLQWVKKYINKDYGFCGIKIYPAAGFFPFDPRLDEVWKYAEDKQIPIMTHCTRGGSWYLGRFRSIFDNGNIDVPTLNPASQQMTSINARILALKADTITQKKNSLWCNIFGHPENYRPVLEKYPRLKICLAHLGGSTEIIRSHKENADKSFPPYFRHNWYIETLKLMKSYENVYSDISYTLNDRIALKHIRNDFGANNTRLYYTNAGNELVTEDINMNYDRTVLLLSPEKKWSRKEVPLINKLMYGTDFFLTRKEKLGEETDLQNNFLEILSSQFKNMAYDAPDNFLNLK